MRIHTDLTGHEIAAGSVQTKIKIVPQQNIVFEIHPRCKVDQIKFAIFNNPQGVGIV
jgi:hypothetical protein